MTSSHRNQTRGVVAAPTAAWVPFAILLLAALLAWSNGLAGGLIYDDVPAIRDNPSIRSLWPPWQPLLVGRNDLTVSGRPLANWTLAVNYALGGERVRGYHTLNVLIHLGAAFTLFGIVRRTLLLPPLGERWGPASSPLALTTSILWIVHPLQTESVTYIVQRVESLLGLMLLLTLYCFIRGAVPPCAAVRENLSAARAMREGRR